jgi:hypothetical protein
MSRGQRGPPNSFPKMAAVPGCDCESVRAPKGPNAKLVRMLHDLRRSNDRSSVSSSNDFEIGSSHRTENAELRCEAKEGRGSDVDFAKGSLEDIALQLNTHLSVWQLRDVCSLARQFANAREKERKQTGDPKKDK